MSEWLWKGLAEAVKAVLWTWQEELAGHAPVKTLRAACRYLSSQRGWIGNYQEWQRQGYLVGGGIIEWAVAVAINRRMKRRGMSWLRPNATSVVALRVASLNDEWLLPANSRLFP
ncbi:MAG TPA: hypothetical protein VFN02_00775 [Ktedonobacteraceae bacterium]|nr:hypothetical protein [Ktedonobacteraceae bacterium]